ncbi:MAG TPA: DUF4235 domain-containing protein [Acidimicrobiia bacterium]
MSNATSTESSKAPIAAVVAPALAFGANIVAGKALAAAYRSIAGKEAPSSKDRSAHLGAVLAWAALSAASAAVIQVAIFRATARFLDDEN